MKRYMGSDKDSERVKELLLKEAVGWRKERLIALKMGFNPNTTLEQISDAIGRSVPSIQRWFRKYRAEGIEALLTRSYPGAQPRVHTEEIEAFLKQGLKVARWNTAKQAQQQLEEHFSKNFSYKTVWYWLKKKVAGVLRLPRPVHEKKIRPKPNPLSGAFTASSKLYPLPLWGPFYELEISSPAVALASGQTMQHIWHIQSSEARLEPIVFRFFSHGLVGTCSDGK